MLDEQRENRDQNGGKSELIYNKYSNWITGMKFQNKFSEAMFLVIKWVDINSSSYI